jgi:hypothetical protein
VFCREGILKLVFFIVFCVLLSACSFNEPYPSEWSAKIADESCESIIGTYQNTGERIHNGIVGSGSFSYAVIQKESPEISSFQIIRNNSEKFILSFENNPPINLLCNGGVLELDLDNNFHGNKPGSLILGISSETFIITKADNNSLVVEAKKIEAGLLMLVIPVGAQSNTWYKFKQLNPPNKFSQHRPSKKTLGLDLAALGRC